MMMMYDVLPLAIVVTQLVLPVCVFPSTHALMVKRGNTGEGERLTGIFIMFFIRLTTWSRISSFRSRAPSSDQTHSPFIPWHKQTHQLNPLQLFIEISRCLIWCIWTHHILLVVLIIEDLKFLKFNHLFCCGFCRKRFHAGHFIQRIPTEKHLHPFLHHLHRDQTDHNTTYTKYTLFLALLIRGVDVK